MKKRIIIFALACTLLFLNACGASGGAAETSGTQTPANASAETGPAAETELTRENAASSVEKMDLGGITVGIGYIDVGRFRDDFVSDNNGDVVSDAVYNRNLAVEEKFNVKFDLIITEKKQTANAAPFYNAVTAGEHLYDIYNGLQCYTLQYYSRGFFADMADNQYIDWEKPWWKTDYMDELQLGGVRYFLYNDTTYGMLRNAGCVYFNKELMDDINHLSDEDVYQMVFDGKWTFDLYTEYVAGAYQDLNGNGTVDDDDLLGAMGVRGKSVEHYQYPADIRTTARDKAGKPYFVLNNERTVQFAEKLYGLFYENKGFVMKSGSPLDTDILQHFINEKSLFLASWFYQAGMMREMEADYGIIPYPKFDEAQEKYKSLVHDSVALICVPVTISEERKDVLGAILEEMAVLSYKTVTPAYFEMAMKGKYSRDNTSSQILDMLAENMTTDFAYAYNLSLKDIGMLRPLIINKTKDFASWYASVIGPAQIALDELVAAFTEVPK